jgi:23S rRNA (adenine2503-C2)-methyltransferase
MLDERSPRSLAEELRRLGGKPGHLRRLTRTWLAGGELPCAAEGTPSLPARLRFALRELDGRLARAATVRSEHPSRDGSSRLLVQLADGATVESVLLARGAVCVSTQVGCAVGCGFCKTGEQGLLRQLSSVEILAQVVLARRRRPVRRVVLMGMGEPAHNLPAVLEALHELGTAGGLGHKNLVFSTVGDPRVFERLADCQVRPALALSLHTTDALLRARLLPRAPRVDPAELVQAADAYSRGVSYPLQVQWTLLEGINDGEEELEGLAELLAGRRAIVNFIPYNDVEGLGWRRPDWTRAVALVRGLKARGVRATLRRSGAQDVDGGCGQLRARALGVR